MASTISSTFASLLNTVGTTANAVTKVVDNAAAGLDMLDMYVMTAKQKQEARTAADMETFYDDLQKETALENAIKAEALTRELDSNANLKKHYDIELQKLEATINRIKTKYNTVA